MTSAQNGTASCAERRMPAASQAARPCQHDTHQTERASTFSDYARCLAQHPVYGFMWLAECSKQAGNWFTFVAAFAVIQQLSPAASTSTHIAMFLVCRRLPYLLLFPLSGLAADRLDRGLLLLACCLVEGAVSFALPLVVLHRRLEMLYPLILLQYSTQTFYDPTRTACIPTVVPRQLICVASTLDMMGFSLMGLSAAVLAGRVAARYGPVTCFRVEGCTFALAACLMLPLVRHTARMRRERRAEAAAAGAEAGAVRACAGAEGEGQGWEGPAEAEPLLLGADADVCSGGIAREKGWRSRRGGGAEEEPRTLKYEAPSVCVVEPDGAPFGGGGGERDGGRAYGQQQQQQPMPVRQDLGQTHIDAHLIPQGGVPPEGCSGAARCEASHRPVADGAIRTDAIANGTGAHGAAAGQPAAGGCPGAGPGTPEVPHVDQDTAACDGYGQAGAGGGGARGPAGGARSGDGGCDGGAALVGTVASARAGGAAESGDRGCNGRPLLQPLLASAGAEGEALFPQPRSARLPSGGGGDDSDGGNGCDQYDSGCAAACPCLGALSYLAARANRDVAALVFIKCTGALCWGAADVLNARFAASPAMQSYGGPDVTLGLILAAVGAGSVLGPLAANAAVPGAARWWRVSIAAAFGLLCCGYGTMAAAGHVATVLAATVIRTAGSCTLWCHSQAILQHRLEHQVRGRVFAVDYLLYTLAESGSTLGGGWAVDALGWGTRRLSSALAALAAGFTLLWSLHAWLLWRAPTAVGGVEGGGGGDGGPAVRGPAAPPRVAATGTEQR